MGLEFLNISTTFKEKIGRQMSTLNKRRRTTSLNFENVQDSAIDTEDEKDEEKDPSAQFLPTQINKLFELPQYFERFVNTLPVFGFNSAK